MKFVAGLCLLLLLEGVRRADADTCHGLACFEDADDIAQIKCKFYHPEATNIYVSTSGSDSGSGSTQQPFATLQRAVDQATKLAMKYTNIVYMSGTYEGNQFADLSSTGCLNTLCLVTEDNQESDPIVTFDGEGCSEVPILSLWNARTLNLRIGYQSRRFAFVNGGYGIQITGDHNKIQISNNTFSSQQESAIYLGGALLIDPIVEREDDVSDSRRLDGRLSDDSDTEGALSEESDRRDFYVFIDHNDFCSACLSQSSASCTDLPTYNQDLCSVVDTHEYDDEMYFHFNLVRRSHGYGVRGPQGGMQVYKNIFSEIYLGGHVLSEYSRVEVNTNWIYDGGALIPQETLRRQGNSDCRDSVFAIGFAPPFGVPLYAVTIGNNLINGIAHVLATFNTERHLHPYENDYCPNDVYIDVGYNTILNIGGKPGSDSASPRGVVPRTGATLIWPQGGSVRADFHSNVIHYHDSNFELSLLDADDDVKFYCNQWMIKDDSYDTDSDTDLDWHDYPNDIYFGDFSTSATFYSFCSGVDYQNDKSDEEFFYDEFEHFDFYTGDDAIGHTLIPSFSPHNIISAWPINFMLNSTADAAIANQACAIDQTGRNACSNRRCCNNIYRRDFSGYRRQFYDRPWTKGFKGYCSNDDDDERCPFYIFWSTPFELVDVPQHEEYPAPDPLNDCSVTTSEVTENCMTITAPPPPRRNPCNGAQNFYIHPDGHNINGHGKSPEQPLRNLEGAVYEINRLIIEENLCSVAANGTANTVNIIYLAGDHFDIQKADLSLLRPIGSADACSTVNILADEGAFIWGSQHTEAIFQIYNLDRSIDLWIGAYDAAATSYQFNDTDADYLVEERCLEQNWGLNIADGQSHGIYITRTPGIDYVSTDEESGERGQRKRTLVTEAKPVSDSIEKEVKVDVIPDMEVVAEVALDAEIHIISNNFNNLGGSAVYSEEPEPTTIQGNTFAFICQNESPALFDVVDPTGPSFCWAVYLLNGYPAVVQLNDFKDVVGSGVKCPFVDDEFTRSQRQFRQSCVTQQNIFRDILYTPWVGYTNSRFVQNWVSCTTPLTCAFGFFLDNKRDDILEVRIYSNLINGVNHTYRHVQAHQISPDMDEIDPFVMDVRIMFNDFVNIQESFGLFQEQAIATKAYIIANVFSSLSPQVADSQEGGVIAAAAEFPNNLVYFCNVWFCGTSTAGSAAGCFLWPETKLSDIGLGGQLECNVPPGDEDTDNFYHQFLREAGFTTSQFEPFTFYTDGSTNFVTTAQADIVNPLTYPVTYRPCETYDAGDGPLSSSTSETFSDTELDYYDCMVSHRFVRTWMDFFDDDNDIPDFVGQPHVNTIGFWEISLLDCPEYPSYQFWWNTDPDTYDPNLAPFPPAFFSITALSAPEPVVVTPTPTPTPIPSRTPTPTPSFSPTPYPSVLPSPSPSPTPSVVIFQRECPVSFCGSWVSVVAFCVNANDPSKECGNYFETNLWEDNFGTQCNCTGGCFAVSGCNNGTVGSYFGPFAFLTTLNVYSNNRTLAQETANNIAKAALQGGTIDGVQVITAVYYPPQQVVSRRGVEFVDMMPMEEEKREVVSAGFDETGVVGRRVEGRDSVGGVWGWLKKVW